MKMVSKTSLVLSLAGFLSLQTFHGQALMVTTGDVRLMPNMPDQTHEFFIQNSGAEIEVTGLQFNVQVADGGIGIGGIIEGPTITALDVLTGTIFDDFDPANLGGTGTQFPQFAQSIVSTTARALPAGSGRIATVTFDTTGFMEGVFNLLLDTAADEFYTTASGNRDLTITNGTLTIIPEPHETAMFAGLAVVAFAIFRRRFRSTSPTA